MEELEKAKLLSVATKLARAEVQEVRNELLEQINSIQIPEAINGLDGRGIVDARIFEGQLVLQLSDGALVTAGSVLGEQGPVGPVGARGEKGDKGDPGPRGDKGDHGAPGLDGKDGAKGETGPNGEKGDTGERGERGKQGVPGQRGQRGERGEQGPSGIDGTSGSDGAKGATGETGPQGVPGRDGKNGKDGTKGLKGDKGDKGDPGSDANTKEIEKKFDSLVENVDKRISRFAYGAATGVKHSGSGEVLLHRLDDVDYNSVRSPTQGQALVWNNTLKKWQANGVVGTGGSITVGKVLTNGAYTNTFTGVTGLRFDDDSGFDVVDLGNGNVKVQMNSTFKYWNVNGASGLTAVGLDTANFIAGSGITISANPANNSITFTSTGGGGTANLSSYLQVANAKILLANTNAYIATKITNAVSTTIRTRNIVPESNVAYSIGTNTKRYKDIWLSGTTIHLGQADISANGTALILPNGTRFANGEFVVSTGSKPGYFTSNTLYNYTAYGLGWMNVAPNQNAATLEIKSNIKIPFGSIWILAVNDGLVDPAPITVYSPNTRTTPMLWMSPDGTDAYNAGTNPNGQAYWFNITPPPSGA
jgi:hypothetical protein